jgi:hypothetical protein
MSRVVHRSVSRYLEHMLKTPVTAWWAVATGLVGIVSFVVLSPTVSIDRVWLIVIIFVCSLCLFIGVSVLFKGWPMWRTLGAARIKEIVRADGEQVFVLEQAGNSKVGVVLEVFRVREAVEIPIGLLEITHEREDGFLQAKALWLMPIHLRDIEKRELSPESLLAYPVTSRNTLERYIEQQAEIRIQDVMKRGKSQ